MPTLYDELGVPTVINALGPATRVGGLPMADEVWEAMKQATSVAVRMSDLQEAIGVRLASLLRVPGVYVTSGVAAALTLAAASTMAGDRPSLIDRLPDRRDMKFEVLVQKAHRDPYDRAISVAGASLIEVGYPTSTHPDELARSFSSLTAAVLFRPGRPGNLLSLPQVVDLSHEHDVPVIVDGSLFVPPVDRLTQFFEDGADIVAVSGGKGFRGPQASGLLCGESTWVRAAALQHQDMDERSTTWDFAHVVELGELDDSTSPPRHGIGRGMKVGQEQIVGLFVAIERYVRMPGADNEEGILELDRIEVALAGEDRLIVERQYDSALDVPVIHIDLTRTTLSVDEMILALSRCDPPVLVGEEHAWRGVITFNPMGLRSGEGEQIGRSVLEVIETLGVAK